MRQDGRKRVCALLEVTQGSSKNQSGYGSLTVECIIALF